MNTHPGILAKFGLSFVLVTFIGLGIWAATAPIQGAIIASGLIKIDSNRKTLQHNEGGIVKSILVKDGDQVTVGQTLILLEDASVSAGYQLLRGTLDAELARQARLEAEATNASRIVFPPELTTRSGDAAVKQLVAREAALFETRRNALSEQTRLMQSQMEDIARETEALKAQFSAEQGAGKSASDELKLYESLREQQFVSTARLLAQQRLVSDYQSRQEQRNAEIARTAQRIKELQLNIIALKNEYSRIAAEGLKESGIKINELRERLLPSQDALKRQAITAPVAGRVLNLRIHTPGAGIGPREPLLEIVPEGESLVIEAHTDVNSIKQLHVGQEADIRFTALPYRTTPLVLGRVSYVSPDVLIDQKTGIPAFQIHVVPERKSLDAAGITKLDPGMAAEIYVKTESRTTLEYLLKPVTDTVMRAFRER
jgi:HlyD family type I secretion membrane fusion protein